MSFQIHLLWGLPGPQKFIDSLEDQIKLGISLLVYFSAPEMRNEFIAHFYERASWHSNVYNLDLSHQNQPPFDYLKTEFPVIAECQDIEQIFDVDFPVHILILDQFEKCNPRYQQAWFDIIMRWAKRCHATGIARSIILPIIADRINQYRLPPKDTHLAYMTWASVLSALEMRMLCRMNSEGRSSVEDQWREFVLPSLSGSDVQLCQVLWDVVISEPYQIIHVLRNYGLSMNWSEDFIALKLNGWKSKPPDSESHLSPRNLGVDLLSLGLIVSTPEYGEEENSAALVLLSKSDIIFHRLWRAQTALLLPMIDEIRQRICSMLIDLQHGSRRIWVDDRYLTLPLEMGPLKHYFDLLDDTNFLKQQWGSGVKDAWWLRNELAHYKPVTLDAFIKMRNLNNRLREASRI